MSHPRILHRVVRSILLLGALVSAAHASTPCRTVCRAAVTACRAQCGSPACRRRCRERAGCPPGRATIRTLAYVETACRGSATTYLGFRQLLRIRRGDCAAETVVEFSAPAQPDLVGLCPRYGRDRTVAGPLLTSPIQRLGVSPDGTIVVYEVTDDLLPYRLGETPPEEEGIWVVRDDGRGRRRLASASRDPTIRCADSTCLTGFNYGPTFAFSPDGRRVAYTDRGPDAAGSDAVQLVVLDLATGARTQVTQLPPVAPVPGIAEVGPFTFLDDETLAFGVLLDGGGFAGFTVRAVGGDLRPLPTPAGIAGGEGRVQPVFQVTGGRPVAYTGGLAPSHQEVFLLDGHRLLQLTNFQRGDTQAWMTSVGGDRVFFIASADPLGRNPTGNCQLFSVGRRGGGIRQLTEFSQGGSTTNGCFGFGAAPGCTLGALLGAQDPETHALVFDSSCDPLGTNPYGIQMFAMRPDGGGLRQLTDARGLVTEPDGTVSVEYVSHWSYSGVTLTGQR